MAEVSGGTPQSVGAVRVGSQVSVLVDGWILCCVSAMEASWEVSESLGTTWAGSR